MNPIYFSEQNGVFVIQILDIHVNEIGFIYTIHVYNLSIILTWFVIDIRQGKVTTTAQITHGTISNNNNVQVVRDANDSVKIAQYTPMPPNDTHYYTL